MTNLNLPTARRAAMVACVSTVALGLTACKVDNRPLLARSGPEPVYLNSALPAPGPLDLAYAPAVQVRAFQEPYEAYSLAERAYGMDRAFYQAEPDYGFDYGEVEPWGWQTGDDWTMYAEPIDDGYRFYYYEPEAEHPYFIRDDQYGYGYDDSGALVALFTLAGVLLPQTQWYDQADVAGRYYYRGEDLRRTARRERRYDVQDNYWRERAPVLVAAQTPWIQAADQQRDWRAYRIRTEARDLNRFEPERARRAPRMDRGIEPDRGTLASIAEAQSRPRGFRDDERRSERQERREARNERPQERAFQQEARLERRQMERGGDDSRRMERQARDQDRQAERQQQHRQRQAEDGRREQQARLERDQARESQRQQREQRQQAENGRRQEMARAAQEERGRAEQRERQRGEQQARQAEQQRGAERQMARNAERQGREAAAQEQQRQQHQQHQQAKERPDGGRGGGGEDRGGGGGGGNGKGGGKKD